jgi:DNA-binding GntR family transcriptional regulator
MSNVIAIRRVSLHDQVTARLRTMVVEGDIPPGSKLNERELCERMEISRTPLREAIKLLAAEGIVELLPHRGAVAVRLTKDDVLNSFEVLADLEALSGALAAQRMTDQELAAVHVLHNQMAACFANDDRSGYFSHNALIHTAINEAARNPVLTGTYKSINVRVQSLRYSANQSKPKWAAAMREHELMIDALDARDSNGLRDILKQHMLRKRDSVLEIMDKDERFVERA